ncbi:hypothetical protein SAMN05660413_03332 [Salegentibacter flavus]|uniref:Uncharacterized protein n=1 Tax=Salegentibacter flavus TaxID=287099 RepID=A0A1I5DGU3_9FLAO|nr:hypothetical protein SAMN05660413_03332 [Salegentibacter flavus]
MFNQRKAISIELIIRNQLTKPVGVLLEKYSAILEYSKDRSVRNRAKKDNPINST